MYEYGHHSPLYSTGCPPHKVPSVPRSQVRSPRYPGATGGDGMGTVPRSQCQHSQCYGNDSKSTWPPRERIENPQRSPSSLGEKHLRMREADSRRTHHHHSSDPSGSFNCLIPKANTGAERTRSAACVRPDHGHARCRCRADSSITAWTRGGNGSSWILASRACQVVLLTTLSQRALSLPILWAGETCESHNRWGRNPRPPQFLSHFRECGSVSTPFFMHKHDD